MCCVLKTDTRLLRAEFVVIFGGGCKGEELLCLRKFSSLIGIKYTIKFPFWVKNKQQQPQQQ